MIVIILDHQLSASIIIIIYKKINLQEFVGQPSDVVGGAFPTNVTRELTTSLVFLL